MRQQLSYIQGFLTLLAIPLLFFTICRALFLIFNASYFPGFPWSVFFYGLRFDLSAISSLFIPFTFLYLLPHPFRFTRWYQWLLGTFWRAGLWLSIALNCVDFEYYKFTLKRSTSDLFDLISYGEDFSTLLPTFVADFWYVVLLCLGMILGAEYLYRKVNKPTHATTGFPFYLTASFFFLLGTGGTVLAIRGGVQLKPMKMINAGAHVDAQFIPLVLNTPFAIVSTVNKTGLPVPQYYPDQDHETVFSPARTFQPQAPFQAKNVVLIILESFSKEFVGHLNPYKGYTPVLDSLMREGYVFTHCFANGKKSIDGVPAILSALPPLMTEPYISSPYSANQINSMASALGQNGYTTSFFHGGTNGTMGFNAFTQTAGFQQYIGREEYPNKADFDGNWGIFDEPFFQFYAEELNVMPQPFFSAFFTLSSHHPFTIPEKHKDRFTEGPYPIHKTIEYTDYSLGKFFERVRTMPWYQNTLFVLTADHTGSSASPYYNTPVGNYAIPLLLFDPGAGLQGEDTHTTQQTDILPTVLDYLGWDGQVVAFGQSGLHRQYPPFAVQYINGVYQLIEDEYALQFDGEQSRALYRYRDDPKLEKNILKNKPEVVAEMEQRLKAIVQGYNQRMTENKLARP